MNYVAFQSELEALEGDGSLDFEQNLGARTSALNFIALVDEVVRWRGKDADALSLQQRTEKLKSHLISINDQLYQRFREQIQAGSYLPQDLRREFDQYTNYRPGQKGVVHIGPDDLDVLVSGILGIDIESAPTTELQHPDMIHYEPTPARVILDLIDNVGLQPNDVLYDFGSGLGQVVILVNLLSHAKAKGIEIDPVKCGPARKYASQIGQRGVAFINADVRKVDYSDGTVFYMFTPFKGSILQTVLDQLRQEGQERKIRLCTYGACTLQMAKQPWVKSIDANADHEFKLAIFESA